jgi:hypothetical protein
LKIDDSDSRVSGNGNPLFLSREFDLVDFFVELIDLDWVLKVRVFPDLNFSVFSSSNKILSIFVNVKSINWTLVSIK